MSFPLHGGDDSDQLGASRPRRDRGGGPAVPLDHDLDPHALRTVAAASRRSERGTRDRGRQPERSNRRTPPAPRTVSAMTTTLGRRIVCMVARRSDAVDGSTSRGYHRGHARPAQPARSRRDGGPRQPRRDGRSSPSCGAPGRRRRPRRGRRRPLDRPPSGARQAAGPRADRPPPRSRHRVPRAVAARRQRPVRRRGARAPAS